MFFAEFIVALLIALLLSLALGLGLGWERPGARAGIGSVIFLFVILFLITWAIGTWARPLGPAIWGVYWLPFLIGGVLIALLLAAVVPPGKPRTRREAIEKAEMQTGAEAVLGAFFWVLIVAVAIAVIARYVIQVT